MKKKIEFLLFEKYKWISNYLSSQVFNYRKLGLDKNDVKQEFDIKLYSIIVYLVSNIKQKKFDVSNIEYYIHSSMINYKIDYIRAINRKKRNYFVSSLEDSDFNVKSDFKFDNNIKLDIDNRKIYIDGVEFVLQNKLYYNLFYDYLIGYSYDELEFFYNIKKTNITNIIYKIKKVFIKRRLQ